MEPLRVVVVDDEANICTFLRAVFEGEGHVCHTFLRAEDAERFLAESDVDLVMVDVYLGATNGIDLLQRLRASKPNLYPVVMTANVSVETAARAISEGAVDYVSKPLTVDQIRAIATRADGYRSQRREPAAERAEEPDDSAIVGRSPKMPVFSLRVQAARERSW